MGFGNLGFSEILVIFAIILLFFGPKRLPEIARGLGGAMREFRRSMNQIQRELEDADPRSQLRDVNRMLDDRLGTSAGATAGTKETAPKREPESADPASASPSAPTPPSASTPPPASTPPSQAAGEETAAEPSVPEPPADPDGEVRAPDSESG